MDNRFVTFLSFMMLAGCGGGDTISGGGSNAVENGELVRCMRVEGSFAKNECPWNINIRYIASEVTAVGPAPRELVRLLVPGESFDVSPFAGNGQAGIAACRAPLIPTQIHKSTNVTCTAG